MRALFIILFSPVLFAQDIIDCSNSSCSYDPNLTVTSSTNFVEYSKFEITGASDDIEIQTPNGEDNWNFKGYVLSRDIRGIDLDLNINSSKAGFDASKFIYITDAIDNLSIQANGFSGEIGKRSSEICAERVLNSDYGSAVRTAFLNARTIDPTLPNDRCVDADLLNIQTLDHDCETNYNSIPTDSIEATRWQGRRVCSGEAARRLCVKKNVKITCHWAADKTHSGCCDVDSISPGSGWSCDNSLCSGGDSGWIKTYEFILEEAQRDQNVSGGISDQQYCDIQTARSKVFDTTSTQSDWYGNIAGSYQARDLNIYPPANSNVKYYKIELAAGGVTTNCGDSNCLNNTALNSYSSFYPESSGYIGLASSGEVTAISCSWTGSYASCSIGKNSISVHSPVSVTNMGNSVYQQTSFSYKVKFFYIDKYGLVGTHTTTRKLGHN